MKILITSSSVRNAYAVLLAESIRKRLSFNVDFLIPGTVTRWKKRIGPVRLSAIFPEILRVRQWVMTRERVKTDVDFIRTFSRNQGHAFFTESISDYAKWSGARIVTSQGVNSGTALEHLRRSKYDLVLNAGGGIFSSAFIEAAGGNLLNAHMGYLPTFRGMNVLEWSLFRSFPPVVSIHYIVRKIDMGDILVFSRIPILPKDSIRMLRSRSVCLNVLLMQSAIEDLFNNRSQRRVQFIEDGKQYFTMHPELKAIIEGRLKKGAYLHLNDVSLDGEFKIDPKAIFE